MNISLDKSLTYDKNSFAICAMESDGVLSAQYESKYTVCNKASLARVLERAWSRHVTPIIRPQDVWTTVAASLARAVNANEGANEGISGRFAADDNKLIVDIADYESRPLSEALVFALPKYCDKMQERNPLTAALCAPKGTFTTETPLSILAGQVLTMAVVRREYVCTMIAMCGLPGVIVEGIAADWKAIQDRIAFLRKVFTGERKTSSGSKDHSIVEYLDTVAPHIQRFIDAFDGNLSARAELFGGIFGSKRCGSGGDIEHFGWILDFYYYDVDGAAMYKPEWRGKYFNVSSVPATIDGFNFDVDASSRHAGSYAAYGGMTGIVFDEIKETLAAVYGFEVKSSEYRFADPEYVDIANIDSYNSLSIKYRGKTLARWALEKLMEEVIVPDTHVILGKGRCARMKDRPEAIIVLLTLYSKASVAAAALAKKDAIVGKSNHEILSKDAMHIYNYVSMKKTCVKGESHLVFSEIFRSAVQPDYWFGRINDI
jgi:Domain of unknown function (DUF4419)